MQILFFHNRYDKASKDQLESLGEGVIVIDVFGGDEIPEGYNLCRLPYLVDKELEYTDQNEYQFNADQFPQIIQLSWSCLDSDGNQIVPNDPVFSISIDGVPRQGSPIAGILTTDVECSEPCTIAVEITNELDGYAIWRCTISVDTTQP